MSARKAGRLRLDRGFSLIEVVIALAVVAFALVAMLGVMSTALITHQDASTDSVFTIMTETAMQEVRNVGFMGFNPASITSPAPLSTSKTYYIYFDGNGGITADAYISGTNVQSMESTTTVANTATYPGIPYAITGTTGAPLTASTLPSGTVYLCTITLAQPTLAQASTVSPDMFVVKMVFSWPINAATIANPSNLKTKTVIASLSNTNGAL